MSSKWRDTMFLSSSGASSTEVEPHLQWGWLGETRHFAKLPSSTATGTQTRDRFRNIIHPQCPISSRTLMSFPMILSIVRGDNELSSSPRAPPRAD